MSDKELNCRLCLDCQEGIYVLPFPVVCSNCGAYPHRQFTLNGKPLVVSDLTPEERDEKLRRISAKVNERYAEAFRKLAEND